MPLLFEDASPNGFIGQPYMQNAYDPVLQQTVTVLNPVPGTGGKIGNTALFTGTAGMMVAPTDDSKLDLNDMTIMFWLNPEGTSTTSQNLISKQGSGGSNQNYQLSIPPNALNVNFNAQLADCSTAINVITSTTTLPTNQWTHVALTFDGNQGNLYFNGVSDQSQNYSNISLCQNNHPIEIGGFFSGGLDELALYNRAMSQQELNSIYLRELRWYRARNLQQLLIDGDKPTITLLTNYPYRVPGYTQLVVDAADETSSVTLLDVGIKPPGSSTFSWDGAARCEDGLTWCPIFDTAVLGGQGIYQLQFRAVDQVGHETISPIHQLIVDDTPPIASSSYNNTWVDALTIPGEELSWGITLTGSITDPLVDTLPGSGVITNVTVSLVNGMGQVLDNIPQPAILTGNTWQIYYQVGGPRPFGLYTIQVNSQDTVGNQSSDDVGTIRLDARPAVGVVRPSGNGLPISGTITQSLTISGLVNELTNWRNPSVAYHFEETSNVGVFYDYSLNEDNATCTNCPAFTPNQFGQALTFDGINDTVNISNQFNPISETFSLSLWFNPSSSGSGTRLLLQQDDGDGQGRALLYLRSDNRLASNLGTFLGSNSAVTANTWHHAALTFDGTTLKLYLNGILEDEATVTPEAANGGLHLGSNRGSSSFFAGLIDEVTIYNRALSDYALYNLGQQLVHGVGTVQVGFEVVDFATLTDTVTNTLLAPIASPTWLTATVDDPGTTLSQWTLTDNAPLENFYTIQLQSDDTAENQSGLSTIWRGLIDRVPPRVTASALQGWVNNTAVTTYTLNFIDFLLDEATYDQPCASEDLTILSHDDPLLPHDGLPHQVSATCQVNGHETSRDITACDIAGHCTTVNVTASEAYHLNITALNQEDAQLSWNQPDASCTGYRILTHHTPYFSVNEATELTTTDNTTSIYDLLDVLNLLTPGYYKVDPQGCSSSTAPSNEVGLFSSRGFHTALTPGD